MVACSFKKLIKFLDRKMGLDARLEILNHLDSCNICREAIYQISRDRDEALFRYLPYKEVGKVA